MNEAVVKTRWLATGNFADGIWCVVLSGGYGCGKTHLAYAAANYRREHGLPYRMLTAPALMAQLRNSIDEKRLSIEHNAPVAYGPEDWVRTYSETAALLILDDLGAQQDTEWATTQLFAILNARYDAELPTLITTNLHPDALDPRLASRCRRGIVVCQGADQRASGR
jgi:DNA replication protein DnaC